MRLDELTRENANLTRQLESALSDVRRQSEQTREKVASKDRVSQTRILDLESQLSQSRAEIARVKREKEEVRIMCEEHIYHVKFAKLLTTLIHRYIAHYYFSPILMSLICGLKLFIYSRFGCSNEG